MSDLNNAIMEKNIVELLMQPVFEVYLPFSGHKMSRDNQPMQVTVTCMEKNSGKIPGFARAYKRQE
ncbi:hypothetical protein LPB41_19430 [Thalassospira sp. MA62]|nr:hypothetical protein [Thalassospira sp. MA62]